MGLQSFWQDLRYGARMLRKSPGFTWVAIITLALGIGANTVIFSVVNAVVLRPLPYPHPQQLVIVWETDNNRKIRRGTAPPADFLDWRSQNHVFQFIAAMQIASWNLTGAGEPQQVWGFRVSPSFFDLLGVKPTLGRTFLPEEEQPGHDRSVILSHGIWVRSFGSNPGIIGQTININENPYTVVGVLPAQFSLFGLAQHYDLWTPLSFLPDTIRRDNPSLIVFARMRQGVTIAQSDSQMKAIASRLEKAYPQTNEGTGARVASMHHELARDLGGPLLVLLAAVGLVLLIACANVANLLLSRAAGRLREVAIRAAMGAQRWRLVRQMLTESLLLGLAGGIAGLLLAIAGLRILPLILPPPGALGEIPHPNWISINGPVLFFTVGVALLTGIVFGVVPAFESSKTNLNDSLKESGRGSSGGLQSRFSRNSLVVAEVAVSLILLIGAVILIRSFRALLLSNPGFNPQNVLSMQVWLPYTRYPDASKARAFFQQVIERIRQLPGVESASANSFLPLTGLTDFTNFEIQGRAALSPRLQFNAHYRIIDDQYFQTMQIRLLRGRSFTDADREGAPRVAIINQTLANQYWPDQDPVGQRIRIDLQESKDIPWRPAANSDWITIVGLVGDEQDREWGDRKISRLYLPYLQYPTRVMGLVLRTDGSPLALAKPVRKVVESVDPRQPVTDVKTMEDMLAAAISPQKLDSALLGFFAALAVVLAAIGIYGVISYTVQQRTHEIGIRLALGAQPGDVVRMIVRQGFLLAILGAALGLAAAFALTRLLAGSLFGIHSLAPTPTIVALLLLIAISILACYIPARRATRVDPLQALRHE